MASSLVGKVPASSVTRGSLRHMSHWLSTDAPELVEHDDLDLVWAAIEPINDPALAGATTHAGAARYSTRPLERHERPGHFTGSALVVHADLERTLVLFHTKLQIWVQPGGHADGDANLARVALREAIEETGIEGLKVWPVAVDLDIHGVDPRERIRTCTTTFVSWCRRPPTPSSTPTTSHRTSVGCGPRNSQRSAPMQAFSVWQSPVSAWRGRTPDSDIAGHDARRHVVDVASPSIRRV